MNRIAVRGERKNSLMGRWPLLVLADNVPSAEFGAAKAIYRIV
jgi:hypothetical protein